MIKITKKKTLRKSIDEENTSLIDFSGSQKMNIMLYLHLELNRFL